MKVHDWITTWSVTAQWVSISEPGDVRRLKWVTREFLEEVLKLPFIRERRVLIGPPAWQWVGLGAAVCLSQPIGLKPGANWKILPVVQWNKGKADKRLKKEDIKWTNKWESHVCNILLFSVSFAIFRIWTWTGSRARAAASWPSPRLEPSPGASSFLRWLGKQTKDGHQPVLKKLKFKQKKLLTLLRNPY